MKMQSLEDLFIDQLKDLHSAENQILKALPKMAKAAEAEELQGAFKEHLEQTRNHVNRLERIFEKLGVKPRGKKCKGMEGVIEEGKEVLEMDGDPAVLDAALIAAAQRVEHYEIAGYGCACTYANLLEEDEAANLLKQTLEEEKQTDEKLTQLAESSINLQAVGSQADGE